MSRTSVSWRQPSPAGASSSGPTQTTSPFGPYQTGIRCPHHNCREMHQSWRLSTQSKYRFSISCGWILTRPSRTASPAAFASGATLTHHCMDRRGSMVVLQREQWPTLWAYGRFSATMRPSARSAATMAERASRRSRPWKGPWAVMTACSSMIVRDGRSWRWPISKSFGSWAGVTLTAPVPNSGSTCSSATTGMERSVSGSLISLPTRCLYRSSPGWTATAVSPSIVSARVVATTMVSSPSPYFMETSSPSSSWYSTSMSEMAVRQRGHQLMMRSAR